MRTAILKRPQRFEGLPVHETRPNARRSGDAAGGCPCRERRLGGEHNGELVLADRQKIQEAVTLDATQHLFGGARLRDRTGSTCFALRQTLPERAAERWLRATHVLALLQTTIYFTKCS